MKKLNLRSGLMATTTIAGALATTMGVTAIVSTVAALAPTAAMAQDYTSGAVIGTVTDSSGKAIAGASVSMADAKTGQSRAMTTNASGQFTATGLPAGDYIVTVKANGFTNYSGTASIVVAQETRITMAMETIGSTQTVVVKGHRIRQDFTKTTTGITVDLDTLTAQAPIARSITAVTMLAPTVVQGVPGFGDVPSIGGASVAENAYYINGLNITNPDTYVGSAKVPFDFYKTVQVQSAAYQAEFGRATGGVVNATTKSGSNDFYFAVHGNFQPAGLQNKSPDTANDSGRAASTDEESASVEMSGPIIKDHLFAYGLYQANDNVYKSADLSGTYQKGTEKDPFYGAKIDGYITPDQHLELTYFTTKSTEDISSYAYDQNDADGNVIPNVMGKIGDLTGTEKIKTGGDNWVAKYTGRINDWFTLSGAYGISKDVTDNVPTDPSAYYVLDYRSTTAGAPVQLSTQPYQQNEIDNTERKFYRIDGDIRFDAMGHHHIRFGLDNEDNSEDKVLANNGVLPIYVRYDDTGIRYRYERLGGHVSAKDDAYYIQDSWDITPSLNLELGLRDDEFQQSNLSGQRYLSLKGNYGPRLGFSWTPDADGNFKIFGNYGVYYIPPAMNLGFRGKDLYFGEYFAYPTGTTAATFNAIDPKTGLPTVDVGPALTTVSGYGSTCPVDMSSVAGHPVNGTGTCAIYGAGVQDPASAKLAVGAKATYENEFVLGGSWRANDQWKFGATFTYRELERVSEDTDFSPYLYDYYKCGTAGMAAGNAAACNFYANNSAYYIWNVGKSSQTVVDWYGATIGQKNLVTLTDLPFPKPKRTYSALAITWDRAWDGKWSLSGSLTLSRLYGNTEGTVKSDAGNSAQADAGSTQDFDYAGLSDYSTGLLPNHHGIEFKTYGAYALTPEFTVGVNLLVLSPMHGSCEGFHPTDPYAAAYGATSFYCDGEPAPRGTGWKSDWEKNVDLSLRYTLPKSASLGGKLVLRGDIFNLFDSNAILQRYAQHEVAAGEVDPLYEQPTSYQAPRYVRVGFDLTY